MNKKLIGLMNFGVVLCLVLAPLFVSAGAAGGGDITVSPQPPPAYSAEQAMRIITNIINYAFGFLLAVVVLMIIIAAYMFIMAGGDPEKLTKARTMLMWALVGLAIAIVARGLLAILGRILGTTQITI